MTWLQTIPTIIVAALIVFVPGAMLARCLGARGLTWAATAAPLTVSLVSLAAIAAQKLHVPWSLGVLVAFTLAGCLVVLAIRLPFVLRLHKAGQGRTAWVRPSRTLVLAICAGFAAPAAILAIRFSKIFIAPENISQTYDNVFHLNAVRFILNTGNGSSLNISNLNEAAASGFYPAAWHDLVALVVGTMSVPIPVGTNAVNMVIGALVWTISSMYLASRVLGNRPAAFLATGALTAAFTAFPYLLVEFGVLYPNFLAIAILPAFMALAADMLKLSAAPRPGPLLAAVLIAVGLPGLAMAHPSILMAFGLFALAPLVTWLVLRIRDAAVGRTPWPWAAGAAALALAYFVLLDIFWGVVRPSKAASAWPPFQTIPQGIGEALTGGLLGRPMPWLAASLMVVGVYAVFRLRRGYWLLGAYAISVFLFVVSSAFKQDDLRDFITQVWYNDSYRLAAMIPVFALPLAAAGAVWLFDLAMAARPVAKRLQGRGRTAGLALGVASWVILIVLAQGFAVATAQGMARAKYDYTATAPLLTSDEHALLMRLDQHVPADGTIIANPATGASLAYALADRNVILPAVGSKADKSDSIVLGYFPGLGTNPAVCHAVEKLNAFYLLDFGNQQVNNLHTVFPTSEQLAILPGLKLLDHEGDVKLYRITDCG